MLPTNNNPLLDAFKQQPQQPKGATTTKTQPQAQQALPAMPTPATWDFKTAQLGLHGEALPKGATGWTPYGTPNFGDGTVWGNFKGKLKEYAWNLTKDVQHSTSEERQQMNDQWNALKARDQATNTGTVSRGQNLTAEQKKAQTERLQIGKEMVGLGVQSIGTWWKDLESNKQSPISWAARGVSTGLQVIGDLFSIPAAAIERGWSAREGFQQGVNELSGPLPKLDQNAFTKFIEDTPLGMAYDVARVALSPDNGNFETVMKRIDEGWNAGRVFYASAFDQGIRQEFIRRYEAGEDPELLGMELSNRNVNVWGHEINANLIEMGGQLIFDPLNVVGVLEKSAKLTQMINRAQDIGGLYHDAKAVEALKTLNETSDTLKAAGAWQDVVKGWDNAVEAVENGKLLRQEWNAKALTVASRENALTMKAGDFIGLSAGGMIREGYSKEDFLEAIKFGVKSLSKDIDDKQEAIAALAKLPNAPRWMGEDAITTYKTIRNLISNEEGVVNYARLDNLLSKSGDMTQFVDEATKMVQMAAKSQFAKIDEMAEAAKAVAEAAKTGATVSKKTQELAQMYERVPRYAKFLNWVNDSKIGQVRQWANNTLGKFYFNYQGGVAVKNVLSNNVLIGIDEGLKTFVGFDEVVREGKVLTRPKIWSDGAIRGNLQSWFGEFKPSAIAGFETAVKAESGSKAINPIGKLMEWGESTGAARITDTAVRDTMRKLLKMENMGDVSKLKAAGFSDSEIAHLERLLYAEKGNVTKVLESYRAYKGGQVEAETVDAWRTLDFLTSRDVEVLDDFDLLDDMHDLTKTAQTTDDIEAAFSKLKKTIGEYANEATKDIPGMSENSDALEAFGALSDAENSGLLDRGASAIFATVTEAADNASKEYMSMLNKTIDQLLMNPTADIAGKSNLANARQTLFDTLSRSGNETKRVSDSMVKSAWYYTDHIKDELKMVGGDVKKLWNKMGLEGIPPADLTQQSLLRELWKVTKERQAVVWNGHFDKVFAQSEEMVKGLGKYMDTTALESQFSQSRWAVQKAQEYRKAVYENGALRIKPMDNILWMAKEYGIPTAAKDGAPLDKTLLGILNDNLAEGAEKFAKLEDVPPEQALQAFEKWRVEKGRPEVKLTGFAIPPAHPDGAMPSIGRAWNENRNSLYYMLDRTKNQILQQWGRRIDSPINPAMEGALQEFMRGAASRVDDAKFVAAKVAQEQRNFTLLNYGAKTYGDVAASWIMPYHFWYTRQYGNWIKRLATSPEVVAGYAKYKTAMERIHYDMPDFFKQNVDVSKALELVGIKTDHPLFLNLEAAVNPLYGLTGSDFNDPEKRVDWFSNTLDDIGKFGPSVWSPLQIANAIRLSAKGETDAAARWGGRLLPETKQLKELLTAVTGKTYMQVGGAKIPFELDPAVWAFSDGLDPYERNRVGRALGGLIGQTLPNGTVVTKEMAIDAARSQEGPIWEAAQVSAQQMRAGPGGVNTLSSWLLGVGFKPRTEQDLQVDQLFADMAQLQAYKKAGVFTPDQFRQEWEKLSQEYPFMETVLLSRRGGLERDSAYIYNVLGRVPPGDSALYDELGINDLVGKFYESKGDMSGWTQTDIARMTSAALDIGTAYAMPDNPTREEWNAAKGTYRSVQEQISKQLGMPYEGTGRGVWDMISTYYDLKDTDDQKAAEFKETHPEIDAAMNLMAEAKINDPLLARYYVSLNTIESYYAGKTRAQLAQEFGADITAKQTKYYNLGVLDPKQAKAYLRQHPELKKYWTKKNDLEEQANRKIIETAGTLPKAAPGAQLRQDFTPQNQMQTLLAEFADQQVPSWEELSVKMSAPLQARVQAYWLNGEPLPNAATKELDYLSRNMGYYNGDDLLRQAGYALVQSTGVAEQPKQKSNPLLDAFRQ